jgi:hypothetical protein
MMKRMFLELHPEHEPEMKPGSTELSRDEVTLKAQLSLLALSNSASVIVARIRVE